MGTNVTCERESQVPGLGTGRWGLMSCVRESQVSGLVTGDGD